MLVSSELEAIRKEVLASSSAPPSPTTINSSKPASDDCNSNSATSSPPTSFLANASAVRVMAMPQPCDEVNAGGQAAVTVVDHRQLGSGTKDASGEERNSARAEALEVALALMQVPMDMDTHTLS